MGNLNIFIDLAWKKLFKIYFYLYFIGIYLEEPMCKFYYMPTSKHYKSLQVE